MDADMTEATAVNTASDASEDEKQVRRLSAKLANRLNIADRTTTWDAESPFLARIVEAVLPLVAGDRRVVASETLRELANDPYFYGPHGEDDESPTQRHIRDRAAAVASGMATGQPNAPGGSA